MTKPNDRFAHGEHNEQACEYLMKESNGSFKDWVITTAFYSSLHFVSSKLFPFDMPAIEGKTTKIENIDQYYSYTKAQSKNISKHELLLELVDKRLDKAYNFYDWLLSTATTARYSHYQHPPEVANRAVTYMKNIKKLCV
jgi:hypothetical protein